MPRNLVIRYVWHNGSSEVRSVDGVSIHWTRSGVEIGLSGSNCPGELFVQKNGPWKKIIPNKPPTEPSQRELLKVGNLFKVVNEDGTEALYEIGRKRGKASLGTTKTRRRTEKPIPEYRGK